jgi:uncharacterized membrane protein YgcG
MAYEHLRNSALPRALSEVLADLADLLQKEIRLARAEISSKLSTKVRAVAWMIVAGVLGLIAFFLVIEAAVFAMASFGIAMHWSCLIVAAVLGVAAVAFYLAGRSDAEEQLTPTRTIHQVRQDIATARNS